MVSFATDRPYRTPNKSLRETQKKDLPEPPGVYTLTTEAGDKPTSIGFSGQAKVPCSKRLQA
eukprot:820303-Amphidinium_carterae.2